MDDLRWNGRIETNVHGNRGIGRCDENERNSSDNRGRYYFGKK